MDTRRADLAKIHIARQQLGMDDTTYRALLQRVAGVTSSAALDERGRRAVLQALRQLGWQPTATPKHGRRPHVARDRQAMLDRIEAHLTEAGRPWNYLQPMVKRFGVERVEFLTADQLYKVLQMLEMDARRHRKPQP